MRGFEGSCGFVHFDVGESEVLYLFSGIGQLVALFNGDATYC